MLTVTAIPLPALGQWPTSLTIVSDKRKHSAISAVTESATITVATAGESKVYQASRETSPAKPATVDPITLTDSRGTLWKALSDDGTTAIYVPA